MLDSRDRNTGALFAIDAATGERRLVHEDARADVGGAMVHPETGVVQAALVNYLRNEWTVIDPAIAGDLEKLKEIGDGDVNVGSRTLADDKWVVVLTSSTAPPRVFLYDRTAGTTQLWFDVRPALEGAVTAPMHTAEIKSRDGLTLPSYYTLPPASDPDGDGKPAAPVPTVLFVHGGPWGRDGYGFNPMHQWLANRGYAVLAVNFRGSTGFGKAFTNAGDLEWGRKMHDDLLDGVEWAVKEGIAQEDKVAIMGGSYGGYATLAGITMTPTEFACGVDIVGPSNLVTLLSTIPPYWGPQKRHVSDARRRRHDRGRPQAVDRTLAAHLRGSNPAAAPDRPRRERSAREAGGVGSDRRRDAGEEHSGDVHPVSRRRARVRAAAEQSVVQAAAEEFLATCLGGRVEPVGDDLSGLVDHGADRRGAVAGVADGAGDCGRAALRTTTTPGGHRGWGSHEARIADRDRRSTARGLRIVSARRSTGGSDPAPHPLGGIPRARRRGEARHTRRYGSRVQSHRGRRRPGQADGQEGRRAGERT